MVMVPRLYMLLHFSYWYLIIWEKTKVKVERKKGLLKKNVLIWKSIRTTLDSDFRIWIQERFCFIIHTFLIIRHECNFYILWNSRSKNKISLEFLLLFTITSLWKNLLDFRWLRVVAGYHNKCGLVDSQSSYWERGLIWEISRINLWFL